MTIKTSTLKNIVLYTVVGIPLILLTLAMFSGSPRSTNTDNQQQIIIEDGTQILELTARGGYSPSILNAKADTPTVLRVITKNTFDCSSALTIPSLNIARNLPVNGQTDIQIPNQKAGNEILVTCSMGMYSSTIKFN